MSKLKGSYREQNVSDAFAEAPAANRRYMHVACETERSRSKETLNTFGPSC
jgi:hypothetical protein